MPAIDLQSTLGRLAQTPFDRPVRFADVAERIQAADLGETPEAMRRGFARLLLGEGGAQPPPVGHAATLGGVDGWLLPPPGSEGGAPKSGSLVVWLHGGGYVFGAPETHWRPAFATAIATAIPVFLPRYRLAPEHRWAAQKEDALAVVRAAQAEGRRVGLAGDSAGGHLALVTALAHAGQPVAALALFSPNTDRTGLSATRTANTPRDPMNSDEEDRRLSQMAFGDHAPTDPEVSPALADLERLPPTHIEVGGREVLLGDSQILAERAREAGAFATLHTEPDAFHMWQLWTPWLAEGTASLKRATAFLREHLP